MNTTESARTERWTARSIIKCPTRPVEIVFAPANVRSNQVLEHAHTECNGRKRIGDGLRLCETKRVIHLA